VLCVHNSSILDPILFMVFANDLGQHVHKRKANLYADDTLIYCSGNTVEEVENNLQMCINDVYKWYSGNKLVLNATKSNTLLLGSKHKLQNCTQDLKVTIDGEDLQQVDAIDYLGMKIDNCLTWNDHISKMCKTISFKISKLTRLRKVLPYSSLLHIYNSFIQPSIDYVITIWSNTTDRNLARIQRLQNYAARVITNDFDYVNHRGIDLVRKLGWMDVKQRFLYFLNILMFKCIHGMAPYYLTNEIIMQIEISNIVTRTIEMNVYVSVPTKKCHILCLTTMVQGTGIFYLYILKNVILYSLLNMNLRSMLSRSPCNMM